MSYSSVLAIFSSILNITILEFRPITCLLRSLQPLGKVGLHVVPALKYCHWDYIIRHHGCLLLHVCNELEVISLLEP